MIMSQAWEPTTVFAMQYLIIGAISMVDIVFAAVCIFKTYLHSY